MVHESKPARRPTVKKTSNRLDFILKPLQNHTLLVWSILALITIIVASKALTILMSPGEIEPEIAAEELETVTEAEEQSNSLFPQVEQFQIDLTIPWLWIAAIALGSGSIFLLWKWLQNPHSHKRAAENRRQRRQSVLLSHPPEPFRVPKRQPISLSNDPIREQKPQQTAIAQNQSIPPLPSSQPLPSPVVEPPTPNVPMAQPAAAETQKSFNFQVSRNPQPAARSTLQVPNFPQLNSPTPAPSPPNPVHKERKKIDNGDRDPRIKMSS